MKKITVFAIFSIVFLILSCEREVIVPSGEKDEIKIRSSYSWTELVNEYELQELSIDHVKDMVLPVIEEMRILEPNEVTQSVLELEGVLLDETFNNINDYIQYQNTLELPNKLKLNFFNSPSEAESFIQNLNSAYANFENNFDSSNELVPESDCDQWEPRVGTNNSVIPIQFLLPDINVTTVAPGFLDLIEFDKAFEKVRSERIFSYLTGFTFPLKWIQGNSYAEPFPITEDCPTNIYIEVSGCLAVGIAGTPSQAWLYQKCYISSATKNVNDFIWN